MRNGLIHSRSQRITLKQEIDFLTNYFELEKKRFSDQFNFHITTSADLEVNKIRIPPLMIQPLCENAIKHAFAGRTDGTITLRFSRSGTNQLCCEVEDDGIGINHRPNSNLNYKSAKKNYGLTIVKDRIRLLNEQGKTSSYEVVDLSTLDNTISGTKITLLLPLEVEE
jgi:LytS/YehU family sensor histidine kinase